MGASALVLERYGNSNRYMVAAQNSVVVRHVFNRDDSADGGRDQANCTCRCSRVDAFGPYRSSSASVSSRG